MSRATRCRLYGGRLSSVLTLPALLLAAGSARADAGTPNLGPAAGFAIVASGGVTSSGLSNLTGDIGTGQGAMVSGFPPGIVNGAIHIGDDAYQAAYNDASGAYAVAVGRTCGYPLTNPEIGGLTLVPGVYCLVGAAQVTGVLTLSGGGSYIFQIGSGLTTTAGSRVVLDGGAIACNVVWQVGGAVDLGPGSAMAGNVLAADRITVGSQVATTGSLVSFTGAVSLDSDSPRSCGAAPAADNATATILPTNTATATTTVTETSSPTATTTDTDTATATATATASPTDTDTSIPSDTATPTAAATSTPTETVTVTSTETNSPTATATSTSTPSDTATVTASETSTATTTSTVTTTATAMPSETATATATATTWDTAIVTMTNPATATGTYTNTPVDTATATATNAAVPSNTATPTLVTVDTVSPTVSATPTDTPTVSGSDADAQGGSATPTNEGGSIGTTTATASDTSTPESMPTSADTETGNLTITATNTNTTTSTAAATATAATGDAAGSTVPADFGSPVNTATAAATDATVPEDSATVSPTETTTPTATPTVVTRSFLRAGAEQLGAATSEPSSGGDATFSNFSSLQLNGHGQTTDPEVLLSLDDITNPAGNDQGWSETITMGPFTDTVGHTLPTSSVMVTGAPTVNGGAGSDINIMSSGPLDTGEPVPLVWAAPGDGEGTYTFTGAFMGTLTVPAGAYAGTYTADAVVTFGPALP